MKIVLITGTRWNHWEVPGLRDGIHQALNEENPDLVLTGGCPSGADDEAEVWCLREDVPCLPFYAQWTEYGPAAGPRRNLALAQLARTLRDHGHIVSVHAFPRGDSPGTRNCIRCCQKAGLEVQVHEIPLTSP